MFAICCISCAKLVPPPYLLLSFTNTFFLSSFWLLTANISRLRMKWYLAASSFWPRGPQSCHCAKGGTAESWLYFRPRYGPAVLQGLYLSVCTTEWCFLIDHKMDAFKDGCRTRLIAKMLQNPEFANDAADTNILTGYQSDRLVVSINGLLLWRFFI